MLVFSKNKKNLLLFTYYKPNKKFDQRVDITPSGTFLQCSYINKNKDFKVKPHIHKINNRKTNKTNEAWIVLQGEIKADLFDIDKKKIKSLVLKKGSSLIMHNGGHSLKVLKNNTIFYEIKNGPYFRSKNDKEDI